MKDLPAILQHGEVVTPTKGPLWPFRLIAKLCAGVTALCNAKIVRGNKDAVYISGRNLIFELALPKIDSSNPTKSTPTYSQPFLCKQEFPTYLICHKYVNGIEDATDIKVYKPLALQNVSGVSTFYGWQFRCTPLQLNIGGVLTTSPSKRYTNLLIPDVPQLGVQYKEVVYPPYTAFSPDVMSTIYATQLPNGDWIDLNIDARKWYKEVVTCTDVGTEIALVPTSHVYNSLINFTTL